MVSFAPQRTQSFTEEGKGAPSQLHKLFPNIPQLKTQKLKTQNSKT